MNEEILEYYQYWFKLYLKMTCGTEEEPRIINNWKREIEND